MAQFQLVSILVHNTPGGDFVNNDTVNVYWDDVSSSIVVKKNGAAFTPSGASQIGALNTNFYVSGITSYEGQYAISGYSFCDGTTLNWFRMLTDYPMPPFMGKRTTANSPVCDVGGGVVCDIQLTGPVVATNTSSLTDPDGTITFSASSSNGTIKYGLSDFNYATEGQLSGSFTGLGTGKYTVYAKDANDCTAQTSVFIFFDPAEAEHYRFTWASMAIGEGTSRNARVRVYEREYVGEVVELDYGNVSPFTLYKPKQGQLNDKFFPIHPTNAALDLASQKDYQFLPLFTQDNKKYRGVYEVDEGSGFVEVWQGFGDPNVYQENWIAAPYFVELRFSDNVKTLENEPFTDDNGGLLFGDMKLIKVIAHIMKKTGLRLKIRSGINIFETNHNTAATDDPLDQTYIDVACYREGTDPFNCWDVLSHILKPFGARIYQYDNQWIIEEIDRAVESYAYRVFDTNGDYESNSTFDPIIDVKAPSLTDRAALVDRDHSLEIIPAYGKIDIVSQLNYVGSIVSGGFEQKDLLSPNSETFNISQGVFTSGGEENFKGWTLRQPAGISGVSFGRVMVSNRGDSSRTGLKTDEGDLTSSVGAFFFNPGSWGGNLRDAYIESSEKSYEYGPNDELKFYFEYSTPARPEYEFMILRMVIKVGDNYLQPDLTWGATEAIYRSYPAISNSLQKFELTIPVPETDVVVDSNVQVRIYYYNAFFYDYGLPTSTNDPADGTDGVAGLKGLATTDLDINYQVDIRREFTIGTIGFFYREFYELRGSSVGESDGIIHPTDHDDSTNPKIWWRLKSINVKSDETNFRRRGLDLKFYIDNVALDALINGQPPPEEETISLTVSDFINEDLAVELYNFDVPAITNAKNMYNNYFRLSDGTPTSLWARSGVSESLTLQKILLKVLGANHSAPTFRVTGSFINEFARIGINNYLRITKKGSSLSASNTEFTTDLTGWTGDVTGEQFAWTADNDGSAEVTLSGAENSEKRYQSITHNGGYVKFTVNVHVDPDAANDREDVLWVLFYGASGGIIHTEKMQTFSAITSADDFDFTYTAFCPGQVTRIGFYFKRVNGTGTCTYQVGQFKPEGTDIQEVYQIADYTGYERLNTYSFELMQISKTYISLAGIDSGGNNQSGGDEGSSFNGDFNDDFGTDFDTILN